MRETRKERGIFGGKPETRRPREGERVTFRLV
jgi:hypothetical protein